MKQLVRKPAFYAIAVAFAVTLLAACTAVAPLKVYEGSARSERETVLITVPEQIQVMSVDGREPPPNFLKSRVVLALLPGEHVFSLRYTELFQVNAENHEVVRSRQAALRFTANAGTRYTLTSPKQANLDAAKQFAKAPQFELREDAYAGEQLTTAAIQSTPIASYAEASLIDTINHALQGDKAGTQPQTNVDLLKDVWSRTSTEEKNNFRAWLDQQKISEGKQIAP